MQEFRAALLRYEGAAEALGRSNGFLLYNIGNTYLRLGEVGRAILHYREAQRFIPSDPNLRQSLRHARSLRRDRIATDAAGSVLRLVFFWHHAWPLQLRVTLFLAAANSALVPGPAICAGWRPEHGHGAAEVRSPASGEWRDATGTTVQSPQTAFAGYRAAGGCRCRWRSAAGGSVATELLSPGPEAAVIVALRSHGAARATATPMSPALSPPCTPVPSCW